MIRILDDEYSSIVLNDIEDDVILLHNPILLTKKDLIKFLMKRKKSSLERIIEDMEKSEIYKKISEMAKYFYDKK